MMMMMMTGFAITNPAMPNVLKAMPRKTASADEAETVETEAVSTPATPVDTPPPAKGKNLVLPIGLGAGAALAGGIGVGQGFWEYAPNAGTMSETEALTKVNGDTALKALAEKELESLKDKKIDEFLDDQDEVAKRQTIETLSATDRKDFKKAIAEPEALKNCKESLLTGLKFSEALNEAIKESIVLKKEDAYLEEVSTLIEAEAEGLPKTLLQDQLTGCKLTLELENTIQGELSKVKNELLQETEELYRQPIREKLVQIRSQLTKVQQRKALPAELKAFEQAKIQASQLIAMDKNTALEQKAKETVKNEMASYLKDQGLSIDSLDIGVTSLKKSLEHIEAYEKLDLKDTPSVQQLTKESLKTATQKVEGFMKWGYAKAEDLKTIGGEELVKHANNSKIALGATAVVAGLGTGALAYTLLNKPKSAPSSKPSAE
jgi:hypothetical protein